MSTRFSAEEAQARLPELLDRADLVVDGPTGVRDLLQRLLVQA